VTPTQPSRGELWYVKLDPTLGHEQAGQRPALVVSVDRFNHGGSGLVVVVPLTSQAKSIPLHVRVDPPEGGLTLVSYAKPEDIRSVSLQRLAACLGQVTERTMLEVELRLRALLGLSTPRGRP
jgi:mRNA interferase MazF